MTKTRIPYWDNVKGILISFVVLGHLLQVDIENGGGTPLSQSLLCVIYFFHMPLFCFISGLFSKNTKARKEAGVSDLLVPLCVFQIAWLVIKLVTQHSPKVLLELLVPQFALWYLLALYVWRIIVDDIWCIRFAFTFSILLFFAIPFYEGLNNVFAIQRMAGFFVFFFAGFKVSTQMVEKLVKRIPMLVAVAIPLGFFAACYYFFSRELVSFADVFAVLIHGAHITDPPDMLKGVIFYGIAFIGAIVLSLCLLRIMLCVRDGYLTKIGRDTMPLYMIHGFVVAFGVWIYRRLFVVPQFWDVIIYFVFAVVIITIYSSSFFRDRYRSIMNSIQNRLTITVK